MDKPNPDEVFKPEPQEGEGESSECSNNTASGAECSEDELCQECVDNAEEESGATGMILLLNLERRMRSELIRQNEIHQPMVV